jgi:hypothetical protein
MVLTTIHHNYRMIRCIQEPNPASSFAFPQTMLDFRTGGFLVWTDCACLSFLWGKFRIFHDCTRLGYWHPNLLTLDPTSKIKPSTSSINHFALTSTCTNPTIARWDNIVAYRQGRIQIHSTLPAVMLLSGSVRRSTLTYGIPYSRRIDMGYRDACRLG